MHRDEQRKEALNAMYYALEEGFYAKNGYYPEKISEENLTVMDPSLRRSRLCKKHNPTYKGRDDRWSKIYCKIHERKRYHGRYVFRIHI